MEVVLMIGIAGAGKTTWANKLFPQHIRISLDEIPNHDRKKEDCLIEKHLKQQHNIVIDDTNLDKKTRSNHIALARKYNAQINACFIDLPMQKIRLNNKNREKHIPEPALFYMKKKLEEPCKDEGFDHIEIINYN